MDERDGDDAMNVYFKGTEFQTGTKLRGYGCLWRCSTKSICSKN